MFTTTSPASTWEQLCPSMRGSQVTNTAFLEGKDFITFVNNTQKYLLENRCNKEECTEAANKLACSIGFQKAGINKIGVESRFPFLSYDRRTKAPTSRPVKDDQVRIAYVILVHNNLAQVHRLLDKLYEARHYFVMHVDAKQPAIKAELQNSYRGMSNVYVLDQSFDIKWGGIEMVYATLEGIFTLLDMGQWDFVVNLSGQDYPICSNNEFSTYLGTRLGKNFDIASVVSDKASEKYWRSRASWMWCRGAAKPCYPDFLRENVYEGLELPFSITPQLTSQWFVYSREFAEFLRNSQFARILLLHYENAWIPDETYFGTVLMNSDFKDTRIESNLRFIVFDEIHPWVWSHANFTVIHDATSSCFTRKLDLAYDPVLFDMIDVMLLSGVRDLTLP